MACTLGTTVMGHHAEERRALVEGIAIPHLSPMLGDHAEEAGMPIQPPQFCRDPTE